MTEFSYDFMNFEIVARRKFVKVFKTHGWALDAFDTSMRTLPIRHIYTNSNLLEACKELNKVIRHIRSLQS